jgi:tellurite resistance protein TerC
MLFSNEEEIHPDRNLFVRLTRYFYPVSGQFHGSRFFVKLDGRRAVTPLFLALVLVESSDVMFAVDSIPAVFAVTRDPFIVFTSNIFAILGLRAMFFVLAGLLHQFRYLKVSLVVVLGYVGVKMLASHHYKIPNLVSLTIIAAVLLVGILASIWVGRREAAARAGIAPEFPAGVEQRS